MLAPNHKIVLSVSGFELQTNPPHTSQSADVMAYGDSLYIALPTAPVDPAIQRAMPLEVFFEFNQLDKPDATIAAAIAVVPGHLESKEPDYISSLVYEYAGAVVLDGNTQGTQRIELGYNYRQGATTVVKFFGNDANLVSFNQSDPAIKFIATLLAADAPDPNPKPPVTPAVAPKSLRIAVCPSDMLELVKTMHDYARPEYVRTTTLGAAGKQWDFDTYGIAYNTNVHSVEVRFETAGTIAIGAPGEIDIFGEPYKVIEVPAGYVYKVESTAKGRLLFRLLGTGKVIITAVMSEAFRMGGDQTVPS